MSDKYSLVLSSVVNLLTYNGEKYVGEQIKSIVSQTRSPDLIIISDDHSTDNTVKIAESLLRNSGLQYIINVNDKNLGIVENSRVCLSLSNESVIFFCDQDNIWDDTYIERFMDKFESNPTLDYVFCNGYVTDDKLNIVHSTYTDDFMNRSKEQFLLDAINKRGFPHGHTVCVKRSFIEKIIPAYIFFDEWAAICVGATGNWDCINENLIYFRRHNSATSFAEREDKQVSIINKIKKSTFDEFFIWPYEQYKAYVRFLELFGAYLSDSLRESVNLHADFLFNIGSLNELSKIKKVYKLVSLFNTKEYKLYRGNRNTLILDLFYLLVH